MTVNTYLQWRIYLNTFNQHRAQHFKVTQLKANNKKINYILTKNKFAALNIFKKTKWNIYLFFTFSKEFS